jgi:hypothetical protein
MRSIAALGLAAAVLGCTPGAGTVGDDFGSGVATGLSVRSTASDVARIARENIANMARDAGRPETVDIVRINGVPGEAVRSLEPGAGEGDSDIGRAVWVVRAIGTFVGNRVPPGHDDIIADSGYLLIDDFTGEVVGMGLP